MTAAAARNGEFAIRVGLIDELFAPLDARPVAERTLNEDVRLHLVDEWERVREARPAALIYAPASERAGTDEPAVSTAVRADLRAHTRRLRKAEPLSRRDRVAAWVGITIFLLTIAVSTLLDRATSDVIIAGISQGIVVIGWVALWAPAQRVAVDIVAPPLRTQKLRRTRRDRTAIRVAANPPARAEQADRRAHQLASTSENPAITIIVLPRAEPISDASDLLRGMLWRDTTGSDLLAMTVGARSRSSGVAAF